MCPAHKNESFGFLPPIKLSHSDILINGQNIALMWFQVWLSDSKSTSWKIQTIFLIVVESSTK